MRIMRQFSIDPEQYGALQEHARQIGGTASGVLRIAIREYLERIQHAQSGDHKRARQDRTNDC